MINGKRVLGLIPARGGSKGIPLKNIQPCGGKPLIAWTIEAARESKYIDRAVVSTDSGDIARLCDDTLMRPASLATDEAPMEGVVLHALDNLPDYDICVLLQPTSPLRTAGDIDGALEQLEAPYFTTSDIKEAISALGDRLAGSIIPSRRYDSVVSVHESYAVPFTGEDPPRRQDRNPTLFLNGAIYAFRVDYFKRVKKFVTPESVPFVMPAERAVDVDIPLELSLASLLIGGKAI